MGKNRKDFDFGVHDRTYRDPELAGACQVMAHLEEHAEQCDGCGHRGECTVSDRCVFDEDGEGTILPPGMSIASIATPGLHKL